LKNLKRFRKGEGEGEGRENMPIKREEDFWKKEIRKVRPKFWQLS